MTYPRIALLLLTAAGLQAGTVGPDVFGYTASDAIYNFTDISATGTRILAASDDETKTVDLGFSFLFYGQAYTQTCISPNGLMAFAGCEPGNPPVNFATTPTSNDLPTIAVLNADWQFFNTDAGHTPDAVYHQTLGAPGSRQFIVQWNQAFSYPDSPSGVTFEAVLSEGTNGISYEFMNVDSGDGNAFGGVAMIGIRDTGGDQNGRALVWSFAGSTPIANESAIQFDASTGSVPEPSAFLLVGGGFAFLGWRRLKRRARL